MFVKRSSLRCRLGIHDTQWQEEEVARTKHVVMFFDVGRCARCGRVQMDYKLADWARREAARMEQQESQFR